MQNGQVVLTKGNVLSGIFSESKTTKILNFRAFIFRGENENI
jgi:hypothetical protein